MDSFFTEWSVSLTEIVRIVLSTMSHIVNGYLTGFFVVTGVVLNVFSIFIFLRCERSGTPAIQYYLVGSNFQACKVRKSLLRTMKCANAVTLWFL